eukprot:CAMPEP_0196805354 /NCGR_PEP_ID=MMETSP1362-20130617/5129_1 /TAXON_ID=163516 /ORGANISM="Leptocylindrus danicus, Strain CCMP1856" /LENGTH=172 /DNA_ID=CAMNT_0042178233 /DNA_START=516 /DNA_END=1034 /DNA_ORIENTATION=-
MSLTWDTLVPAAAPKYSTFEPGFIQMLSTPPKTAAANLDRNGFHTRYSNLVVFPLESGGPSTEMRFSPYTATPGVLFKVTKASSFPRAMKMPSCLCGSMITLAPPFIPPPPRPPLPPPPRPPRPRPPPRPLPPPPRPLPMGDLPPLPPRPPPRPLPGDLPLPSNPILFYFVA